MVTKLMWPDALDIVGFASESGQSPTGSRSEDAMYSDVREWTPEMQEDARRLQQQFGILVRANQIEFHEREYPVSAG